MAIQIPIDAITSRFGDRFNSIRSQSVSSRFANLRPVSEFLDLKRLSKPANFGEVQSRVNYNLGHFSSNYAVVFVMLSVYSLLTNWALMFLIILVSASLWGIGKLNGRDLDLGFRRFNTSQLYTALLCIAVPLAFWASPLTTILWLIGATGVTVFGHAALMDKPIENAFSEEAV
ncbi:Prenylated Rab acceptor 1 [Penicillium rolfsii]|nr:Prenylated Rab acceptor 1 [Penicillium rolfsii]